MTAEPIAGASAHPLPQPNGAGFSRSGDIDRERFDALLRERARWLAMPERTLSSKSSLLKVVLAQAGHDSYALDLTRLAGVAPYTRCAEVAGGPPELLGVVNAKSAVWAVFDAHRLFAAGASATAAGGRIVLLRHARRRVALRFNAVDEISELDLAALKGRPAAEASLSASPARAVTSAGLIVLDFEALWTHPSLGGDR